MNKALAGDHLSDNEVLQLLDTKTGDDFTELMETAYQITKEHHKTIKLTSTVHITNQCEVTPKCKYCGFAAGTSPEGYYHPFFKTDDEIREAVISIEKSGIPRVSCSGAHGYHGEQAVTASRIVKENTSLELLVNVGADLNRQSLEKIAHYETETVCCNLETTNERLFHQIKPGESLQNRIKTCQMISDSDVELSSGLLIGIGESHQDRLNHLKFLKRFKNLGEIPIMGFNPYRGTPMENHPVCSLNDQMRTIAVTRILFPDIRITVPTPTIGPENVKFSLMAGANNLATVIPDTYPLEIKGVGSPACGTLMNVLKVTIDMGLITELRTCFVPVLNRTPLASGM
ncbi:5,10-methenyltetrahydromethanopterin hydrogenase cofactor biosynthesis protein HmdB [Methanospirillum sp.]|uniref:5,10-methenyltetrahydromethanopterin hydrogenase cofactor biosynthesis protein HmdB n=1 Tax=Methanospirillum sp. TaxID=45200 RepID=UPI0026109222|nr:5,10-methenyltetrahydromethanopterin hydrogenase cofactor biosynthesis protein HmdB [Methanospirillum sp.]